MGELTPQSNHSKFYRVNVEQELAAAGLLERDVVRAASSWLESQHGGVENANMVRREPFFEPFRGKLYRVFNLTPDNIGRLESPLNVDADNWFDCEDGTVATLYSVYHVPKQPVFPGWIDPPDDVPIAAKPARHFEQLHCPAQILVYCNEGDSSKVSARGFFSRQAAAELTLNLHAAISSFRAEFGRPEFCPSEVPSFLFRGLIAEATTHINLGRNQSERVLPHRIEHIEQAEDETFQVTVSAFHLTEGALFERHTIRLAYDPLFSTFDRRWIKKEAA